MIAGGGETMESERSEWLLEESFGTASIVRGIVIAAAKVVSTRARMTLLGTMIDRGSATVGLPMIVMGVQSEQAVAIGEWVVGTRAGIRKSVGRRRKSRRGWMPIFQAVLALVSSEARQQTEKWTAYRRGRRV